MSALLRKFVATGALVSVMVVGMAGQAMAAVLEYVMYYVVAASYQGQPENLSEIASRFLGGAGRAADIFALNSGRTQPDGGQLDDQPDWTLAGPWSCRGTRSVPR